MLSGVLRPLKQVLPGRRAGNKNSTTSAMAVDSVALMVSSGLNAVLGVVYWMAVTNLYSVEQVGRATTLINAGIVFSSASILAFGQMLERFLPVAGERRPRIVLSATAIVTALSLLLSGSFVLFWPTDALLVTPGERLAYPVCVAVLTVFALYDSVLVGVHLGRFAAVKNVIHAVVKLITVVVAGLWLADGSAQAIIASWIMPAAVLIVLTQMWLYLRSRARAAGSVPDALPPRRDLVVYFLSTTGWIVGQVLPGLFIPLLVERLLGLAAAAYFNIAWIVVAASIMLMSVVSGPFVASASRPDADLAAETRSFRKIVLYVSGFRLLAVSVAGPIALLFYGWDYAAEGTPLLVLMGIAHAMAGPALIYGALSKVYRCLYYPMTVQLIGAVVLVGLVWWWLPSYGIVAVGWAFIVHDVGVLLAAAVPLRNLYRRAMAGDRGVYRDGIHGSSDRGSGAPSAENEAQA